MPWTARSPILIDHRETGGLFAAPKVSYHMSEFTRPRRLWLKILSHGIRIYLSLILAGCASKQPAPSIEEIRQLETTAVATDFTTAFDASINLLQDLGFGIDEVNTDAGIITASKQSQGKLGTMFEEIGPDEEDDGLPTWAIVLLIATGVIIVIGIIALIASDDDDDDEEESREKGISDHHHGTTTALVVSDVMEPEENEYYTYRVTMNLTPVTDTETKIRTSVHGSRMKGDNVEETGSVYDARFFLGFYNALGKAMSLQSPAAESEPDDQP